VASEGDFPAGSAPGGRKILGLKPKTALITAGIVLAAAIGYLLWKRSQASSTAASTADTSGTDTTGSSDSGVDYGGELSVIQSELEDLLAADAGAGTGSGTGTATGTGGDGATNPIVKPPAKTTVPPGSTKTAPKPVTGTTKPPAPAGVHATKVTPTSVTLAWSKSPNATGYTVRVTYQDKLVGAAHNVTGTSTTVSGLGRNRTYTFHVAARGPGGTSSETNGPAVKTKL
jgi:hypothetical protein